MEAEMPLVYIYRDAKKVDDATAIKIRDLVHQSVALHLKMNPDVVLLRVRDVGPLDKNYSTLSIEIDTGPGYNNCRLEERIELAKTISADMVDSGVIPPEWVEKRNSDLWLRILAGSAFLPIGHPDLVH